MIEKRSIYPYRSYQRAALARGRDVARFGSATYQDEACHPDRRANSEVTERQRCGIG
jgi:hypothetical protein